MISENGYSAKQLVKIEQVFAAFGEEVVTGDEYLVSYIADEQTKSDLY